MSRARDICDIGQLYSEVDPFENSRLATFGFKKAWTRQKHTRLVLRFQYLVKWTSIRRKVDWLRSVVEVPHVPCVWRSFLILDLGNSTHSVRLSIGRFVRALMFNPLSLKNVNSIV